MTEFEIITLVLERRVEMIALMQWWAGVSFAILEGAQIFESKLSWRLVILIEAFYLFFTVSSMRLVYSLGQQFEAAFVDLKKIELPSDQALAMLNQFYSGSIGTNQMLLSIATLAAIAVTCAYPIWLLSENENHT